MVWLKNVVAASARSHVCKTDIKLEIPEKSTEGTTNGSTEGVHDVAEALVNSSLVQRDQVACDNGSHCGLCTPPMLVGGSEKLKADCAQ